MKWELEFFMKMDLEFSNEMGTRIFWWNRTWNFSSTLPRVSLLLPTGGPRLPSTVEYYLIRNICVFVYMLWPTCKVKLCVKINLPLPNFINTRGLAETELMSSQSNRAGKQYWQMDCVFLMCCQGERYILQSVKYVWQNEWLICYRGRNHVQNVMHKSSQMVNSND